ncbi:Flp pilus assembly protein TadB [Saccharopolyspora lacisalsi]|uniref:Flp pilus assembly protein TadB n=1 Tax=Halosaccharopolyspora lacisalsi TaxID=1000566 RepID=A0A839DWU0_9PSEU|nr:type II secretion system F family protein [Halosaccharopolyspora lacisalsi]MBA8823805.1 Flp pilus assembly protein TadB [Halosaccharopolyspora lacisalsi]
MITTALVLGAGIGLGLWSILVWLLPARPTLASALAATRTTSKSSPVAAVHDDEGWAAQWGRFGVRPLAALGLPGQKRQRDLQVLGRRPEALLAEKAVLAVAGLFLPPVLYFALAVVGTRMPWQLPFAACLVCAAGGFLLPDLDTRQRAEQKRTAFRHALSAYLNLVRVCLAGGAGVDGALTDAARIGQGWAFAQIRRALTTATLTRSTPWSNLRQLGEELGVRELVELSSSVSLAGTEGAKVRASLAAKATAMRTHELTEAEGEAQAATERMSLPVICLFAGFLIFIGYPAVATVLGSL